MVVPLTFDLCPGVRVNWHSRYETSYNPTKCSRGTPVNRGTDGKRPTVLFFFLVTLLVLIVNPTASASTINVPPGGDLQAALNNAQCGDTVVVAAASYVTSADWGFVFPAKSGGPCVGTAADTITVQTANIANLPTEGQRVSAADAGNMPKQIGRAH